MRLRNTVLPIAMLVLMTACSQDVRTFGDAITEEGAISNADLNELLASEDSVHVKLAGTVGSVCQTKGCWMGLQVAGDEELFVEFKDYGYFVPKNCAGNEAIVEGWLKVEKTSVDELKHLAHDAGKSQEEIDDIVEPTVDYAFVADGVILKK